MMAHSAKKRKTKIEDPNVQEVNMMFAHSAKRKKILRAQMSRSKCPRAQMSAILLSSHFLKSMKENFIIHLSFCSIDLGKLGHKCL